MKLEKYQSVASMLAEIEEGSCNNDKDSGKE